MRRGFAFLLSLWSPASLAQTAAQVCHEAGRITLEGMR